jgi:diguanylate cyclase (GGDEF)-like protein
VAVVSEREPVRDGEVSPALSAIWERHRATVLAQVEVLEQAAIALTRDDLDATRRDAAKREAHKLAGSLGTFGFHAGSEHARGIERLLGAADPPGAARAPALSELVSGLSEAVRERGGAVATPPSEPPGGGAPLLLIVEDDLPAAQRLASEAERSGLRAALAASPDEARAAIARARPDAVLLDLTFDGTTGDAYELLSQLREAAPPVPVLVSTVQDELTDRLEVARRGGHGFATKSIAPQQAIEQVTRLVERAQRATTTVLAVDDDPLVLDAVRALLEPHEFRVATLGDPLRFWDELDRVRPDVVLLDVDMPGATGIELCRVLRNDARWATVPVLILTARRDAATIEELFAAGADDHLTKPVLEGELLARIRNRAERQRLHRALAETDGLTGVPNRPASTQGLERLLRLAARNAEPLALATVDLDRFKQVNDRHGHAAGDAVLRGLGEQLLTTFRGEDVVGRWGGEEFVVGMYGMDAGDAQRRLMDLLDRFREERFVGADGERFGVAFSAGLARFPEDGEDLATLYRAADAALYRAKDAGRGRVVQVGAAGGASEDRVDVVLVEDDEVLGELLVHTLETRGYGVRWLRDGALAASALTGPQRQLRPRLVLLDVELPGLDGVGILRALRDEDVLGEVRVIMLTARASEEASLETLELGAFDHVGKPFSTPVLMHKVARALE